MTSKNKIAIIPIVTEAVDSSAKPKSKAANLTSKNTGLVLNCYGLRRRRMKAARVGKFIRPGSAVYMAVVLEYLMAEV